MASINGISAKGITKSLGHEGETVFQGNLYLGGKKLGFWSQDSWGGEDRFVFDSKYSVKLLDEAVKRLNPEKAEKFGPEDDSDRSFTVEYDLSFLLYDFLNLLEDEKEYKKAIKAGFAGILITTDGYHRTLWRLPKSYTEMTDKALLKKMNGEIAEAQKSFFKERDGRDKHIIKIYRSLDDFILGEPISVTDIMAKP